MSKKLLTKDAMLVSKVENVLKQQGIPCARVQLYEHKNGDAVRSEQLLLVVLNRHGEDMRNAINSVKTVNSKFFFGVLRNHPEYRVPRGILKELEDE